MSGMDFVINFPLFAIILSFAGVVISSLLSKKWSRIATLIVESIVIILNVFVLVYTYKNGSVHYSMGHFPAPFDNEIRFGVLESLLAIVFPLVIMLSLLAGVKHAETDIEESKKKYIYVLLNLALVAVISLIYTNDIFTGYVFLEILTLSSVGLIMIKDKGNTIIASVRYLIFNLVGSGLFLIGCVLLYDLTGYLSMEYILKEITVLASDAKNVPIITFNFALLSIGLGIKSGLFPFYYWMPDAYGEATTTSACVVSGIVSKGYIVLLIKFMYRTFGMDNLALTSAPKIMFVLGVSGIVFGSISAIKQKKINRMIAFSSAAQIGYIYMGLGCLDNLMVAVIIQILSHCITKPLLFASSNELVDASNNKEDFQSLKGSAHRNIFAGIGFAIGAFSMIGFPATAGFVMKYLYIKETLISELSNFYIVLVFIALVVSTLLNVIYYIRTMVNIYQPNETGNKIKTNIYSLISIVVFVLLNVFIGLSPKVIELIELGLSMMK